MASAAAVRTNWTPDKKHSDMERWICVYPGYINSKKSRQEGRRLPKDQCIENPTYLEIRDVLSVTNLRCAVENKEYSREKSRELQFRGRIRIQMRNNDGTPCNPELATRDSLLQFIATKIPQLKSRQNKSGDSFQSSSAPAASQAHHSGGGGGGGHKKGKGKRR
ncbi:signal recognition particle 19 kDa protein [Episyrphus balteatus]|uniref:signal recognition particle 19 kDa protein n=1 Tax=Episyrphus balteatus TaxID=286459 RepID=UPI0024858E62|nr:signal recognition particle 19 kDa protein [Episyrphus balteatus]